MNIQTPIATWILARLYDEPHPVPRKDLLKHLCQKSFDSMTNDSDFAKTIDDLIKSKYIEFTKDTFQEFVPIRETDVLVVAMGGANKMKEVTSTREGYVIAEDGIIAFRRQIATPLEKIKKKIESGSILPASYKPKFEQIVNALKTSHDIIHTAIIFCVDDAPQILEFIKMTMSLLGIQ